MASNSNPILAACVAAVLSSVGSPARATPITVTVPGTVSIWLANQPDGTTNPNESDVGEDVAPQSSPILVPLSGFPDAFLTFQSTGATSRNPDTVTFPLVGAEGANAAESLPPALSVSGLVAPASSLVGVFFDSDDIRGVPNTLGFGTPASRDFDILSPRLQQLFFIGDGLTGVGTGLLQRFRIPLDADTLYLATFDSGSFNNVGALEVTIDSTTGPPPSGSEPSALLLLALGAGLMALGSRVRPRS